MMVSSDAFSNITNFNAVATAPPIDQLDRWCTRRADWKTYSSLFLDSFTMYLHDENIENFHDNTTSTSMTDAGLTVQKSIVIPGRASKLWRKDKCSEALRAKKSTQ